MCTQQRVVGKKNKKKQTEEGCVASRDRDVEQSNKQRRTITNTVKIPIIFMLNTYLHRNYKEIDEKQQINVNYNHAHCTLFRGPILIFVLLLSLGAFNVQ